MFKIYAFIVIAVSLFISQARADVLSTYRDNGCVVQVESWWANELVSLEGFDVFDRIDVDSQQNGLKYVSFAMKFTNMPPVLVTPITVFVRYYAPHMYDEDQNVDVTEQRNMLTPVGTTSHTEYFSKLIWPLSATATNTPNYYETATITLQIFGNDEVLYEIDKVTIQTRGWVPPICVH